MKGREAAYLGLMQFEKHKLQLNLILNEIVTKYHISSREKKFVYNLANGVLRYKSFLDWKVSEFYQGKYARVLTKLKVILRLAVYEIDYLDHIPVRATVHEYVNLARKKITARHASVVNGILRNYIRTGKNLNPEHRFKYEETRIAIQFSYPEWLIKRWIRFWGVDETRQLCNAMNQRPVFDLWINTGRITVRKFSDLLNQAGVNVYNSDYSSRILKVYDIQKIVELDLFKKGYCRIQDESAQLAVAALDPQKDDKILDACAAPGGKFMAIHDRLDSPQTLVANDVFLDRLQVLKSNCVQARIDVYNLVQSDFTLPAFKAKFDKILLDVPCSGLGTIQKNPDIKWRRSEKELAEFNQLQSVLLEKAVSILKPGGIVVYCTCTIDPDENENVINRYLARTDEIVELRSPLSNIDSDFLDDNFIKTFPHRHGMDGSFAAIIHKKSAS